MLFLIKTMTRRDQEKCIKEAQQRPRPIARKSCKIPGPILFGICCAQGPSFYKASKAPNPILLGSVAYQTQESVALVRWQTQTPHVQLHVRPKCLWVWRDIRLNPFGFGNTWGLSACVSGEMLDSRCHDLEQSFIGMWCYH
jgi:hypothetical protein